MLHRKSQSKSHATQACTKLGPRNISIAELHSNTWFLSPGVEAPAHTVEGTRPGSPLGDLIYSELKTDILKEVAHALDMFAHVISWSGHRNVASEDTSSHFSATDSTYADDSVFSIAHSDFKLMPDMFAHICEVVSLVFARHGLRVNIGPRKTEAMVFL